MPDHNEALTPEVLSTARYRIVLIRNSKDRRGPYLTFNSEAWGCFVRGVQDEALCG